MSTRDIELPVPDVEELDTAFKRRLAVAVSLIALIGGLVGFAAANAGAREADVGREAQRSSIAALARQNDAGNAFYEDHGNFVERLLASTTVQQEASNLALRQYNDWVGGMQLCRPESWTIGDTVTGSADMSSADGRRHVSMRATPLAVPPDAEATRTAMVAEVLDRLTAQLSPSVTMVSEVAEQSNSLPGTARYVMLSPTEQGYVWVSLTAEGVLRATYARYPYGDPGEVIQVIQRTRYLYAAA